MMHRIHAWMARRIPTYALTEELKSREGVQTVMASPHVDYEVSHKCTASLGCVDLRVNGPAVILVVID